MNKKKLFVLLPAALLALSGCNPTDDSSESKSEPSSSQVTTEDSKVSSEVSSEEVKKTGKVTITNVPHATITADKLEAEVGTKVVLSITIEDDWKLVSLLVNGATVEVKDNKAEVLMVEGGLTVSATLEQVKHEVTIAPSTNGTVVADKTTAIVGDDVTFTITPNDDYELDTFKINGNIVEVSGTTYVAKMVKAGLSVEATFKALLHDVKITAPTYGKVTTDKTKAVTGENVTITVTPDEDCHFVGLRVNGEVVSVEGNTAVVQMTKDGLNIVAEFAKNKYNVTIVDAEGGRADADVTSAAVGEEVGIEVFVTDDEYEFDKLLVNGEEVEVDSDLYVIVEMVKGGITVTPVFKKIQHSVTIPTLENGTVVADKNKAAVGDDVTFTVSPAEGFHIESFKVNGTEYEVGKDGTVKVKMTSNGLTVAAVFSDVTKVAEFTDALKTEISEAENIKLALSADTTVDNIPVAKKNTIIDLGGHTLTVTGSSSAPEALKIVLPDGAEKVQDVTFKNGTILYTCATQASFNIFSVADAKAITFDGVTFKGEVDYGGKTVTGIQFSNATNLVIKDSTIDLHTTYAIGTNNEDGKNATVLIENSSIKTTTANKDNCAFLGNVVGLNVTIKESSFQADRQAVIARTGTWKVSDSSFTTTGEFLDTTSGQTTNADRLNWVWKTGNEVIAGALVVGDKNDGAYNESVNFEATNLTFAASKGALKLVAAADNNSEYTTTVNLDAYTYVNAYDGIKTDDKAAIVKANIIEKTIAEMNAMTKDDVLNLYCITGTVQTAGKYAKIESDSGELLTVFNGFKGTSYFSKKDDKTPFYLNTDGASLLDNSDIGKKVTLFGTFKNYQGTKEICNAKAFFVGEPRTDLIATITANDNTKGTVALSKTSGITYGEEITVTATPIEGYKVAKVTLTDVRGEETDITNDMKFNAGLTNTVKVDFVSNDTKVAKTYNVSFDGTKIDTKNKTNSYTNNWKFTSDDIELGIVNFNNNNGGWKNYIKCGSNKADSVASISTTTAFENPIGKTSITIDAITSSAVNSIKLYVSSNADFKDPTTYTIKTEKGTLETIIENPTAGQYFKYEFNCKKGSSNGLITISSISFAESL